ncbi:hypothetical protein A4R35_16450 [Thermogemmatispora tikiterensis]|uniref:Uncharacterized protein n=1 Tax=Thermogemmatispora tikiterensis TaxID=1825093 RepID=A0A328VJP9_9CHLR|nr:hypothetical protein A4R35_16450 [Thermogemmatispora tikiterensis]
MRATAAGPGQSLDQAGQSQLAYSLGTPVCHTIHLAFLRGSTAHSVEIPLFIDWGGFTMLKKNLRWIVPLVVLLAVVALALTITPLATHAASPNIVVWAR